VYYRQYAEQISVAQLVRETATVMQEFTRTLVFGLFIGSLICFFVCFFVYSSLVCPWGITLVF